MGDNQCLMVRVELICGPLWDAISPPGNPTTTFPKAFVMALTAGETGAWLVHNPDVPSRFETSIYQHLLDVQWGTKKNYGAITTAMLQPLTDAQLRDHASSWSLTQILGYMALGWKIPLAEIQNPATHYNCTLRLLGEFEHQYMLDPQKDFDRFFRCWNTGSPTGKTYDPAYVQNGLDRMEVWKSLQVQGG